MSAARFNNLAYTYIMFGVSASGTGDGPPSKLVCRRSTASGRAWMDVEHKIHERARAPLLELVPLTKETMAEVRFVVVRVHCVDRVHRVTASFASSRALRHQCVINML